MTQVVKGINKLSKVIDWELFREELESILGYMPNGIGAREGVRPLIRC